MDFFVVGGCSTKNHPETFGNRCLCLLEQGYMLRHHIQLFWMHAGEAGTGSVSSPMFRSSGLILRRAVRKCWDTVGEHENTLQNQMFILAKFVLLRVRNGFCGGTSEQPPSITRISGVGKSWIVHRSMSPCSSKHRH